MSDYLQGVNANTTKITVNEQKQTSNSKGAQDEILFNDEKNPQQETASLEEASGFADFIADAKDAFLGPLTKYIGKEIQENSKILDAFINPALQELIPDDVLDNIKEKIPYMFSPTGAAIADAIKDSNEEKTTQEDKFESVDTSNVQLLFDKAIPVEFLPDLPEDFENLSPEEKKKAMKKHFEEGEKNYQEYLDSQNK